MRIKVIARKGELRERLSDAVRVLRVMAGEESLAKSDPDPVDRRELLIPALRESVNEAAEVRDRIQAVMLQRMLEIIGA